MVRSSITESDRKRAVWRLKAGLVVLVAVSAGIVAYQAGATGTALWAAVAGGTVVGGLLTWFVARNLRQVQPDGLRDRMR